jgi:hypothetical protein
MRDDKSIEEKKKKMRSEETKKRREETINEPESKRRRNLTLYFEDEVTRFRLSLIEPASMKEIIWERREGEKK